MTFIKLSFVIKIFILSIFEWSFYTGFTVCSSSNKSTTFLGQNVSIIRVIVTYNHMVMLGKCKYSKTCVKQPLSKRPKNVFQDQLSFNAGQKYCRMLQWEHFAILSTFIKLSFVIKIFVSSIFSGRLRLLLSVLSLSIMN